MRGSRQVPQQATAAEAAAKQHEYERGGEDASDQLEHGPLPTNCDIQPLGTHGTAARAIRSEPGRL